MSELANAFFSYVYVCVLNEQGTFKNRLDNSDVRNIGKDRPRSRIRPWLPPPPGEMTAKDRNLRPAANKRGERRRNVIHSRDKRFGVEYAPRRRRFRASLSLTEIKTNFSLLLDCLKFQTDSDDAQRQALTAIATMCSQSGERIRVVFIRSIRIQDGGSTIRTLDAAKTIFRTCGGLKLVYGLMMRKRTGYRREVIFALACAAENCSKDIDY